MQHFTVNLDCSQLRTEYLEGEKYLVAPVVLMTPDVHDGSRGPLLYRERELDDYSPAWNHKPIVLNHPKKGIACTRDFLNQYKMGILLGTEFKRKKQRAEAWFNEKRTAMVSPQTLTKIKRREMMEVSTGLFVDQKGGPGKFHGKQYKAIAANHKPDHLAILPDSEGACGIKDGGGLFQLNAKRKSRIREMVRSEVSKMLNNSQTEETVMVKSGKRISKKEFVRKLITNKRTTFKKEDRGWLMKLDPKQLRKLMPKKAAHVFNSDDELEEVLNERLEDKIAELRRKQKRNKKKELQKNRRRRNRVHNNKPEDDDEDDDGEDARIARNMKKKKMKGKMKKKGKGSKKTRLEDFLENQVPDELRPIFNQALAAAGAEEERLIKIITSNKATKFKAKDLKKLAPKLGSSYLNHLRGLAALARNSGDEDEDEVDNDVSYFGAAGAVHNKNDEGDEDKDGGLDLPVYNNERFAHGLKLPGMAGVGAGNDDDEEMDDEDE